MLTFKGDDMTCVHDPVKEVHSQPWEVMHSEFISDVSVSHSISQLQLDFFLSQNLE